MFEVILPGSVRNVVFANERLFVHLGNLGGDLLLFSLADGRCSFTSMLAAPEHQGLINRRLRHVHITSADITFVYNNRVRVYDLTAGRLIHNRQVRGARDLNYEGPDIIDAFVK